MGGRLREFIVICQSAWMNESGFGIDYNWDGARFPTRARAIKHGWKIRGSDDFNIGVVEGENLLAFCWMDEPMGEDDATMLEIAEAIGLGFTAGRTPLTTESPPPRQSPGETV